MASVLRLDRSLDVKGVAAALEAARKACASSEPVEVDGSEVEAIDSAGAQLLFSFSATVGARARWVLSARLERELSAMGFPLNSFSPRTS